MWFKNLRVYLLQQPFNLTDEALAGVMESKRFQSCGSHDLMGMGWDAPLGRQAESLVHEVGGCQMVCVRQEEKLLPAAVINEILEEKVVIIEQEEGRKVARRERSELREEVFHQLLPKAFSHYTRQYAMIDKQQGWILVDAASVNKAEVLVTLLRETLGSLPVKPLEVELAPTYVMTEWLKRPEQYRDFRLLDSCELKDRSDEASVLRCKGQDLSADEMMAHIDAGKEVVKLAVEWDERLSCIIDADMSIKRLRFLDLIQEQAADYQMESDADAFDGHFTLMSLEFRHFLPRLFELFGGTTRQKRGLVCQVVSGLKQSEVAEPSIT
ncbi:MAG: recombination-associated protein RdgC [Candidatus Thiodiazotropha sp. (ex Lucinoma aequizonata)]|nr:recombination-associated protein RdgC [Candidatus Thiodiazotropha sp. (ex Lucinoma aequizonata)]MCU7886814.1 recombination-associated protein RdgC [Candidatus Thiodiazotropha sp. (ex Lucinoma aequizonata)]MCU7895448.1 recombination-associated protein RdgC [Candidatus Thiodiazotropha sp. (ex Lucinoma aequizonata)]MCU7897538.1 recombination-associated protein RdgC [Candidatus Thiodiazotropha sp. (ex Lucinoma aequizonata)]MCU7900740.1 recombination-associated protein RdgC [Candidatus Thiodiazot